MQCWPVSAWSGPAYSLATLVIEFRKWPEGERFSVVREYCGHGIGEGFHEEPQVVHYGKPGTGLELQEGMVFTIEPMINAGKAANKLLPDAWTVVTKDRKLSAQWEHTIAVTADGYEVPHCPQRRNGPLLSVIATRNISGLPCSTLCRKAPNPANTPDNILAQGGKNA